MKNLIAILLLLGTFLGTNTWAQTAVDIGYTERGYASYYADDRGGILTQSGEKYNGAALEASHAYLPLQTYVQVTNLDNGLSVVVRINDRHANNSQYSLFLSRAAAEAIGALGKLSSDVKIEVVAKPASNFGVVQVMPPSNNQPVPVATVQPVTATQVMPAQQQGVVTANPTGNSMMVGVAPDLSSSASTVEAKPTTLKEIFWKVGTYNMDGSAVKPMGYGVQVGSFMAIEDALEEGKKFQNLQFGNVYIQSGWDNGLKSFRVLLGSFSKEEETKPVIEFLNQRKYQAFTKKHLL